MIVLSSETEAYPNTGHAEFISFKKSEAKAEQQQTHPAKAKQLRFAAAQEDQVS